MGDEEQIRQLVATWQAATQAGDVATVLSLMTDDVVFLVPGRPPMLKDEFASLSQTPPHVPCPEISGQSNIEEIQICGDWAFMRTHLEVRIKPPGSSEAIERAGYTLTILRKVDGRWLLARDANLLTRRNPAP